MFILQHKPAWKKNVTKGGLRYYRVYDDSLLLSTSVISCCGRGCCLFSFLLVTPSTLTFSNFVMRQCSSFQQICFPCWGRKQSLSISQVVSTIKLFFPGFILCACLLFSTSEPQFWTTALFLYSVPMARERSGDQNICKSAEACQSVVEWGGRDKKDPEGV